MPPAQRTVQICLFVMAAIALIGGVLQMSLGQPDTTRRLDNVHRFLAGIYLGCGFIAGWAAITIRRQGMLVYLIALAVFIAAIGRLISMAKVCLPEPAALWLAYVISELAIPVILVAGQYAASRRSSA